MRRILIAMYNKVIDKYLKSGGVICLPLVATFKNLTSEDIKKPPTG